MLSRKSGDDEQITQLEHDLLTTRRDQRGYEMQRGQAIEAEARALHLLDASRSIQGRCDVKIAECIDGIRTLQDELAALIPRSREPS